MARKAYEEAIRLYLETAGDEQLRTLIDQLGDVGDTADFQSTIARKAFERLGDSIEAVGKVDAFVKLKNDLLETEAQLERAQTGAQELFSTFKAGDDSNSGISRMQNQARKTVNDLSASVQKQRAELQQLRGELSRSGVDTGRLGSAQSQLRARMAQAQEALAKSVKSLQQYRQEQAKAAAEVPASNERIAQSYGKIGGALASLRSIAGPLLAFLSFQTARAGIANLVGVAKGADDAKRALQEMYGSVEAGNGAYDDLADLAKRNGLAFDVTLDAAKKLKAFGLDPLGGSLQALIDQNAAAGGSQEDLSGKVLALGQAWAKQKLQGEEILQLVERGVPVWDLLQKSTGKNVQELQKLSEAGKLGRDVISGLIAEIGKANSGAAERSLSGLSGLIAKASAQWLDFRQKIVAAGVGDYFKAQIQLLLNSSGGLDGLAKKIGAAIIATAEGLKSLAQTMAPFVSLVGNVTLGLARNAEALALLAKAYAGVKIVDFYQAMARGLLTMQANNLAMRESAIAASESTGAFGRLGGAIKGIPRAIGIGVIALGIDSIIRDVGELIRLRNEQVEIEGRIQAMEASQSLFAGERIRQAQEMQSLYAQYSDVVIQSNAQIKNQSLDQAEAYRLQLEQAQKYFKGIITEAFHTGTAVDSNVRVSLDKVNAALAQTNLQIKAAGEAARLAATDFTAMAVGAVTKFDDLVAKGKTVKDSIGGIFDGVDFTRTEGITNAVGILDQMAARGSAAAAAVRVELRTALAEVSTTDLPQLQRAAEAALTAGSTGAKQLAEDVGRINLARLGVDIDAIKTGYTQAGRAAVDSFREANREVDRLQLDTAQRSMAISKAFTGAFSQAATSSELEALKQALRDALSGGNLNNADFKQAVAQVESKLAQLADAGRGVGQGIAEGAQAGATALNQLGGSAQQAAGAVDSVGTSAKTTGDKAKTAEVQVYGLASGLGTLSEKAIEAYKSVGAAILNRGILTTGFTIGDHPLNRVTNEIRDQVKAFNENMAAIDNQLKAYDDLADRRRELSGQYDFLGQDRIDQMLQAEQRVKAAQKSRNEEQARVNEEQRQADIARLKTQEELTKAAGPVNPVVAQSDNTVTIKFDLPEKSLATAANAAEGELIERLARLLMPKLLQHLERARAVSTRTRLR